MPRETVHTELRPYGDEVPAVSAVEVAWAKDGAHVQLATVLINADDGLPYRPEPGAISSGHYVQLTRKELNELIRKLKRAGAQTFGTDEWAGRQP